jgi:predicted negative regulator of RcsB-dependent stress response
MPTAPTLSKDPALEAHVFWYKFRAEILGAIVLLVVGLVGFAGYQFYSVRREATAAASLASAKDAQGYQQVIANYGSTPAGATAHLLLAQAQRKDGKFTESNATLQTFIEKNPKHELVATARRAIATNLESMGKIDEALAAYQRVVADHPKSFEAPLALISEVTIFKNKHQDDAARRACETILTQYRDSLWANEAMQELRSLKSSAPPAPVSGAGAQKPGNVPTMLARPPAAPAPSSAPPVAPPKPKR